MWATMRGMHKHREQLELADQMHRINHRLRRHWGNQLAPHGLSPHYYRALAVIARAHVRGSDCQGDDVAGVMLRDIAERLRIAPRSATEVVDGLEERGWAQRVPHPHDRRATLVVITEAGQQLFEELRTERLQANEEFFAVLSAEDRQELSRLLGVLIEAHPRPSKG